MPVPLLLAFLAFTPADSSTLDQLLARVAEEAEVFQENIPNTITQETFEQRAMLAPSRFRPRVGKAATETPKPRLQVRQIVSEYSVGAFSQSGSRDLHEFRQVISVDGRAVQSAESARHALSLGIRSEDDRLRKRMLENFARYGLVDIATDYGLILLEFTKRGMENLEIRMGQNANIGADPAVALLWKQKTDAGGQLEFSGKRTIREPLQGILWVRASDGLPLRVEAWAEFKENDHVIANRASVDYVQSSHGFLTPVSVVHRHLVDNRMTAENTYRYQPFKKFSSDAEIKFTEVPEAAPVSAKTPVKR
jgi:hypothetical protein